MGVSERVNPGHIIVNNLIRKDSIEIASSSSSRAASRSRMPLRARYRVPPERVDIFVLCIDAAQASGALVEVIERQAAESIVLIPGGLEEKAGSEAIVQRMHDALAASRTSAWAGPSSTRQLPGYPVAAGQVRHDVHSRVQAPVPSGDPARLAIISQSGAFAVARASKLNTLNPKYAITLGNQMDLTVGDYLTT